MLDGENYTEMLGRKNREQLVSEDHVLARVDRVSNLGWLHEEVSECYCRDNGRLGIDPEVAVRLMVAGRLLALTGSRRGEALNSRWCDFGEVSVHLRFSKTGPSSAPRRGGCPLQRCRFRNPQLIPNTMMKKFCRRWAPGRRSQLS